MEFGVPGAHPIALDSARVTAALMYRTMSAELRASVLLSRLSAATRRATKLRLTARWRHGVYGKAVLPDSRKSPVHERLLRTQSTAVLHAKVSWRRQMHARRLHQWMQPLTSGATGHIAPSTAATDSARVHVIYSMKLRIRELRVRAIPLRQNLAMELGMAVPFTWIANGIYGLRGAHAPAAVAEARRHVTVTSRPHQREMVRCASQKTGRRWCPATQAHVTRATVWMVSGANGRRLASARQHVTGV